MTANFPFVTFAAPGSTRRRFDVDTTLFGRQQRCYNIFETTSCVFSIDSILCFVVVFTQSANSEFEDNWIMANRVITRSLTA